MTYDGRNRKRRAKERWKALGLLCGCAGPKARKLWVRYQTAKNNNKSRRVGFLLSFEEWFKLWNDSGHLWDSGKHLGQYQMCRTGDLGPYAVGNVRIATAEENHREMRHTPQVKAFIRTLQKNIPKSKLHRSRIAKALKGKGKSAEARKNMSAAAKRRCARLPRLPTKRKPYHG